MAAAVIKRDWARFTQRDAADVLAAVRAMP